MCIHYKLGFCKHGDHCRKIHYPTKCERKECDATKCEKRHPRECRYFRDYKRCKFGDYCLYDHSVYLDPILEELKLVKERLEVVEKEIEEKNEEFKRALESLQKSLSPHRNQALPVVNNLTNQTCPPLDSTPSMSTLMMLNSSSTAHTYQGSSNLGVIPQLDGSTNLSSNHPPNQLKPAQENECDNCQRVFESKAELEGHNEIYQFGCEDCFVCFTSKFYADLHELELHNHPDNCYVRDHIPNSTKLQFAAGVR